MSKPKKQKSSNKYGKYSGLGMQLMVLLFLSVWIGQKLDSKWGNGQQYYTVGILLFALITFFYKLFLELEKDRHDQS